MSATDEVLHHLEATLKRGASVPALDGSGLTADQVLSFVREKLTRTSLTSTIPVSLEAIIKVTGRPSFLTSNQKVLIPEGTLEEWVKLFGSYGKNVEKILPSLGRINLENSTDYSFVGTGWIVSPGIVVSNRHVANLFSKKGPKGYEFLKDSTTGETLRVNIDFYQESRVDKQDVHKVEAVLFVTEDDANEDLSFLKVSGIENYATIPLHNAAVMTDMNVAVIGYPAQDSQRNPDPDALQKIFGGVYDVKRVAPGKSMGEEDGTGIFTHDASTLGGNSGSLVLDLATGKALGLHYAGSFKTANYAVASRSIQKLLQTHISKENPVAKYFRQEAPTPSNDGTLSKFPGSDEDGIVSFINCLDPATEQKKLEQYQAIENLVSLGFRYLTANKLDPRNPDNWKNVFDLLPHISPGVWTEQTYDKTIPGTEVPANLFAILGGPSTSDKQFMDRITQSLTGLQETARQQEAKTTDGTGVRSIKTMLLARVVEEQSISATGTISIPKLRLFKLDFSQNLEVLHFHCKSDRSQVNVKLRYYQYVMVVNWQSYKAGEADLLQVLNDNQASKLNLFKNLGNK